MRRLISSTRPGTDSFGAGRARVNGRARLAAAVAALLLAGALPAQQPPPPGGRAAGARTAGIRSGESRNVDERSTASRSGTRAAASGGRVQCEKCHADRQFLVGKARSERGDSVLFVPDTLLRDSRHQTLTCGDCHAGYNDGYPHASVPAVAIRCQECHADQGAAWENSIHAPNFVKTGDAATCVSCHSSHRVLGADDVRSPTYPLNVARLCGSCHSSPRLLDAYFKAPGDTTARSAVGDYRHSVHGIAMSEAGLVVSATCSDCHDAHAVLPRDSTQSTLSRANVAATCGACHAGVLATYDSSAHGRALVTGDTTETGQAGPVCVDCHGGHKVVEANDPTWFRGVVQECGACHARLLDTYFETYHGKATELGYGIAAKCSDCHTAHAMQPADDSTSSVHPANLVETCRQCHAGANANFVMYKPHGDPHDRERNPELYWVWLGMSALLLGVFAFFGLHTYLWLTRSGIERMRRRRAAATAHAGGGSVPAEPPPATDDRDPPATDTPPPAGGAPPPPTDPDGGTP